jgi:Domain of unknown function (DUF892)
MSSRPKLVARAAKHRISGDQDEIERALALGSCRAQEGALSPKPPLRAVQANDQINDVKAMGFFSKDIRTMDELFVHTLRDIYYAEQKILQALPTMIEDSANPKLRSAFEHHMAETQNHVRRVEQVFDMHDAERKAVNCPAIDGIIKEAKVRTKQFLMRP